MSADVLLKSALVYVTALFYFAGWMYLYYFLGFFGVSIFSVDIPFHYFFVYAFAIVRYVEIEIPQSPWSYILLSIGVLGFLLAYMARRWQFNATMPTIFFAVFFFGLFFVVVEIAQSAANHHGTTLRRDRASAVRFAFDPSKISNSDEGVHVIQQLSRDYLLTPIFETPKALFVLDQPVDSREPAGTLIMGSLYVIDKSALLFSERTVRSIAGRATQ